MTFYPFNPSPLQNPSFNVTLGGATYVANIVWSFFGQRWYLNLIDSNGNLIISTAMVSSQDPQGITSITWLDNEVTVQTTAPHGLAIGSVAELFLSGNVPTAYNGLVIVDVTGPSTFTFELTTNPGQATAFGSFGTVIDLSAGLIPGSMLLFYNATNQFASTP